MTSYYRLLADFVSCWKSGAMPRAEFTIFPSPHVCRTKSSLFLRLILRASHRAQVLRARRRITCRFFLAARIGISGGGRRTALAAAARYYTRKSATCASQPCEVGLMP